MVQYRGTMSVDHVTFDGWVEGGDDLATKMAVGEWFSEAHIKSNYDSRSCSFL